MRFQGIHFRGFRKIKTVNLHGNNGNSDIDKVNVLFSAHNYKKDGDDTITDIEPYYEECRLPKVAVVDLLNNYNLTKETREVLVKYTTSLDKSQKDFVFNVGKLQGFNVNWHNILQLFFITVLVIILAWAVVSLGTLN